MAYLVEEIYPRFRARIQACTKPELARDILSELLICRHNYFAQEFCNAIGIEYRNDVPAEDLILEMIPDLDPLSIKVPNLTPDNYYRDGNKIYVIDFKVSISDESSIHTFKKYNNMLGDVFNKLAIEYEIVIIRMDPSTMRLYISSDQFSQLFPNIVLNIEFNWYFTLRQQLFEKFENDPEFMEMVACGEFTPTFPWVTEPTPELLQHPIYHEFLDSLEPDLRQDFLKALDFNAFSAEKWNDLLHSMMFRHKDYYKDYTKKAAKEVFLLTGDFEKPTRDEISKGWSEMVARISETREITADLGKQKPSVHFIWSKHDPDASNENIAKLLRLSKYLKMIPSQDNHSTAFKHIGQLMDFSDNINAYNDFCTRLKTEARNSIKPKSNAIQPIKIGTSTVLWEQQFKFDTEVIPKEVRIKFLKEFCGIGNHKLFKDRLIEDLNLEKPRILDFTNPDIQMAAKHMVDKTKITLMKKSGLEKMGNLLEDYQPKIESASKETWEVIKKVTASSFWQAINDISILVKNILAVSQYNKHNTFRIVTSANNSFYGIVYPAASIKSKKSTIVFSTITIHTDEQAVLNCGALYKTYRVGDRFISISKAMRLDKERCQRIVTSPGLFMLTTLLFKHENDIKIEDIMTFSFFTSLSITKSMLSLTEPSRYMIMNSLALSSHVREYIAEKFSPYTKTLFSVYMTDLIRRGCMSANDQKELISLKSIYLNEYEITQKGVSQDRNLHSIWFPGKVNLKQYINQIYLPFYFNAKGLHNKHHVMIDLTKTILEIEREQRIDLPNPWSTTLQKQSVNCRVLIYSIAKMLNNDTSKHNHLRNRVENRNNFKRSLTSISTFTSSKSCIKVGDFFEYKAKTAKHVEKIRRKDANKTRIANTEFVSENERDFTITHSTYLDLKKCIPKYTDYISTKVFDRLYEKYKYEGLEDKPAIEIIMDTMLAHKDFKFCFFNKGQKTSKDREIFVGEFEAKLCLYGVERIAKERCKLNPEEMISEPGDGKLRKLEQNAENEIRTLITMAKVSSEEDRLLDEITNKTKGIKLEINADMSKWSAQDVFFKYFWLIVLDPILYPYEKQRIIYFLCNYMQKELILPDDLMCTLLDQRILKEDDIIRDMTDNYQTNCVNIKRNWLQGNLNYTSSYIHSCSMMVFKDIIKDTADLLQGQCHVSSMVHSDDNQTSLIFMQDVLTNDVIIEFVCKKFEDCCKAFGNQANMKKTYITNHIKEFVSLFNIYGEPFSIYGRFLLPSVGDCAYIGPYEDMASRLSATQTAIKHGCPPSLAWVSIALNHWITFSTYNMLPGQINDPTPIFGCERRELPIELCGLLQAELPTIALVGLESGNISFLTNILRKMSAPQYVKESVQVQCQHIEEWQMEKLSSIEILKFKLLRYVVLDSEVSEDDKMGETSDMRSRSLITPRKFTTPTALEKLVSYKDFQDIIADRHLSEELFLKLLSKPELLVTKGENSEEFLTTILYRYNSKKFKESLSIQTPTQLFIEQILFSNKPIIDYTGIKERFLSVLDIPKLQEGDQIIGRKTIPEAFKEIISDLSKLKLDLSDIKLVYSFCILNDPLNTTACNSILLSQVRSEMERTSLCSVTMPEFRNMKLIKHSPALVLRAYVHNRFDIGNADEDALRRDVYHLVDFINQTKMEEKLVRKIQENAQKNPERDYIFELREYTKFYQTCYDYIKSTEHKVKVFILPMRAYTAFDFCAAIHGNLLSDNCWYSVHYLRQIISGTTKAMVSHTPSSEQMLIDECFKLATHFCDTFISPESRIQFLYTMIETFSYKGFKIESLLEMLLNSPRRVQFLPLLYWTRNLTQSDLDKYDANKTNERISWNDWQINREMNTGKIDLTIKGYLRSIRIIGEDDRLIMAELEILETDKMNIESHGRKLLNARHNLKFERMAPVEVMEPHSYYICAQKKTRFTYSYQLLMSEVIEARNKNTVSLAGDKYNILVPVCFVNISRVHSMEKIKMYNIKSMNQEYQLTRLQLTRSEFATIRRCHFSKMVFFDGNIAPVGKIDMSKMIKTPALLTTNYSALSQISLFHISKIFYCDGAVNTQDEFEFLSDDILEDYTVETINTMPIFEIAYTTKSKKGYTYKQALQEALRRGLDELENEMSFTNEGFFSPKNMSIIALIISLIDRLNVDDWSFILKNCIHIAFFNNGKDSLFHLLKVPKAFVKETIGEKIDWQLVKVFLTDTKCKTEGSFWDQIFEEFKEKCLRAIDLQLKLEGRSWGDIVEELDEYEGVEMFNF
ncbi:RNA-dependent RNA polymerase [Babahoya virus]|uniref:RNA-directed RNA polymerase L n=1 Tax=Babahoya virus TaxID=2303489 RepID=A0A346JIX6_9VIRU|nr:RNA-dependent RNA polymerase protein [Babahoya virus]AXP33559.1 RNA-dependent RNA polymerase [Babahoya virus]